MDLRRLTGLIILFSICVKDRLRSTGAQPEQHTLPLHTMSGPLSVATLARRVDELTSEGHSPTEVEQELSLYLRGQDLTPDEIREKISLVSEFISNRDGSAPSFHATLGPPVENSGETRGGSGTQPMNTAGLTTEDTVQEEVRSLRRLIAEMRDQMANMAATQNTPTTSSAPTPAITAVHAPASYHTKFPDPEAFGGDRKSYRHWKIQMKHKVQSEQNRGGMEDPKGYIFSRLKGDAARAAITYIERSESCGAEGLWSFLDAQYLDPILDEKARDKLYNFKQGKTTLTEYIQEFNRLMYEADEQGNTPALKSRFRVGLREDLRDKMVSVEVPKEWTLERLQERVRGIEENMFRAKLGRSGHRYPHREDTGDPMEDVRTKLHETRLRSDEKKKRAKWVSKEVLQQRKDNDLCIRCGGKSHVARDCNYARAMRPTHVHATSAREDSRDPDSDTDGTTSEN